MVPHFGQGAGQAIEDGFALAVLLENARQDEIPVRLDAYQRLRLERCVSRSNGTNRLVATTKDCELWWVAWLRKVASASRPIL